MFVCNKRWGANSMFLWSLMEFRMDSEWGELVGTIQIEYQCKTNNKFDSKAIIYFSLLQILFVFDPSDSSNQYGLLVKRFHEIRKKLYLQFPFVVDHVLF